LAPRSTSHHLSAVTVLVSFLHVPKTSALIANLCEYAQAVPTQWHSGRAWAKLHVGCSLYEWFAHLTS